ncbi:MAG: MFS transporter [Caulobacteraceae bacterium]|nr:MFS transporter [Caulobacter sp.]
MSARVRRRQWVMVALLVAAGCVNYIDRSTLSVANRDIASELHLSPGQMGGLLSAFAWAYALCQLPVGAVTDRLGPRLMLTAGMAAWSVAQVLSGAVRSFGQFLVARAALGVGESPMFTAGARAVVNWFPVKERGLPLGLFNAASSLGPAIAPPILTALMLAFGWRPMFVLIGVLGFFVALAWGWIYRDPERSGLARDEVEAIHAGEENGGHAGGLGAWLRLVRIPTTWAMIGGLFGIVYVTWLYVTWLPAYLEGARHVGTAATGWLAAIPQAAGFVGACLGGFLSDGLAKLKVESVMSRKAPTVAGLLAAAAFTAAAPFLADTNLSLAMMSAALFCAYGAGSCSWALGATLAPREAVATLESIQNIGGSIGGALAPLVTGLVVQATGAFKVAFVIAAAAAAASAVSYALVRPGAYDGLKEEAR